MITDNDKFLYKIGWAIFTLILFIISFIHIFEIKYQFFMVPCLFNKLTGLYCPGCGGTRSVEALLHGHPMKSIQYNPIVVYGIFLYAWYMFSNTIQILFRHKLKIGMKYRDLYFWIGLLIVLAFCIIRNILLVVFHIDLMPKN
jgi:hypothetical protein